MSKKFLFKFSAITMAAATLVACGGGGDTSSGIDNTVLQNNVAVTLLNGLKQSLADVAGMKTITAEAGTSFGMNSSVSVLGGAVSKHQWAVENVSGDGTKSLTLVGAKLDSTTGVYDCTNVTKQDGKPASGTTLATTGRSVCNTTFVIPGVVLDSQWQIRSIAETNVGSKTQTVSLVVKEQPPSPSGFALTMANRPQMAEKGKLVTVSVGYSTKPGYVASDLKYEWKVATLDNGTTISGTQLKPIIFQNTDQMTFYASETGTAVYDVTVTATINGVKETKTGRVVVIVEDAIVYNYDLKIAKGISVAGVNSTVTLDGALVEDSKNTGTPKESVKYEWSIISTPDGSTAPTIYNKNSLTGAQFMPTVEGKYLVQLKGIYMGNEKVATAEVYAQGENGGAPTQYFTVSAGDAQSVDVNASVKITPQITLANGATFTPGTADQGYAIKYLWTQTSGPAALIANASSGVMSFVPKNAGTYVFQVAITLNGVTKNSSTVVEVVVPAP